MKSTEIGAVVMRSNESASKRLAKVISEASRTPLKAGIEQLFKDRLVDLDPSSSAARELQKLYVDMMNWLANSG